MNQQIVRDVRHRASLERLGFVQLLEEYEAYLECRGYAERTIVCYGRVVTHFGLWAGRAKIDTSEIKYDHLATFQESHMAKCRCRLSGTRVRHTVRAALNQLKEVLHQNRRTGEMPESEKSEIDHEIDRFDSYLRETCGLSENTRIYRRRYARDFLAVVSNSESFDLSRLTTKDIVSFVMSRAHGYNRGSAQVLTSSLRSYLRYRQFLGECDETLIAAVPRIPRWSLSSLPKSLSEEELRRLLRAFDRKTATGRRDYAMTRCITDLGLRAREVAGLCLEDVNWRTGMIRISGGKSRRDDDLPLTSPVARAIIAYLRRGRPRTSERSVFIRHRPPVGDPVSPMIVRNAILYAAARAGMSNNVNGTSILRHTAATRMLRKGASLKEVADVLRHRDLETTMIYTKVDLPRLAAVAMPWPEGHR